MSDELGSATADSSAGSSPAGGSATATPDAPVSSSAGGTVQPGASLTEGPEGPIPYQRFKEVNDKYGSLRWAEAYQPETVQRQKQFFDWLDSDPVGAHEYLTGYLKRNGILREPAPPPAQGDGRPQPDVVVPETGQRFYSAEAAEKLAKWQAEQIVNDRFTPVEQQLQQYEQERVYAQAQQAAQGQLGEADTWPHFKGNERDILAAMEADNRLSLEGAYRKVVFPRLRELERKAIVAETQQKAQAGTVNPGAVAATSKTPLNKLSMQELFRREFNKRAG
jgi:hypothetical protein